MFFRFDIARLHIVKSWLTRKDFRQSYRHHMYSRRNCDLFLIKFKCCLCFCTGNYLIAIESRVENQCFSMDCASTLKSTSNDFCVILNSTTYLNSVYLKESSFRYTFAAERFRRHAEYGRSIRIYFLTRFQFRKMQTSK